MLRNRFNKRTARFRISADSFLDTDFDHQPICMECKKKEELKEGYPEASQALIGQCMADSELTYGVDPEAFCYHHFYPFTC